MKHPYIKKCLLSSCPETSASDIHPGLIAAWRWYSLIGVSPVNGCMENRFYTGVVAYFCKKIRSDISYFIVANDGVSSFGACHCMIDSK